MSSGQIVYPQGPKLNDDILLLLAKFTTSSVEVAKLIHLTTRLAPSFAHKLYQHVELATRGQAFTFFATIAECHRSTRFYCIVDLVENIQVAFNLDFKPAHGIPKEQRMEEFQRHVKFMDLIQFNIRRFTRLKSLNVVISPAWQDPFGLVRVANVLYKHGPRQPISVRLKCLGAQVNGQFRTKDWNICMEHMFRFWNVTGLQIITIDDVDKPEDVQVMLDAWTKNCTGQMASIEIWTGARNWVQGPDFGLSPCPGPSRSGNTFASSRVDSTGVWEHVTI